MDDSQLSKWRTFACALAQEARTIAVQCRGNMNVSTKVDRSIVTEADHRIQHHICHAIQTRFPSHAVLCEEEATYLREMPNPAEAEFCWVIDPLDGTRNYVRGMPCYCTSIALLKRGQPVVGVIGDMNSSDVYSAVIGKGAWRNDDPIQATGECSLGKPVVSFQPAHKGEAIDRLPPWTKNARVRNLGSTAMHLAYVATGALDGAVCMDCRIWDVAAGYLLVVESGGRMTLGDGSPLFPIDMQGNLTRDVPFVAASLSLHNILTETAS